MKKLLLLLVCPMMWLSCTKEEKAKSLSEELRESEWIISSYKVKYYDSTLSIDTLHDLLVHNTNDCIKDNKLKFLNNYEGLELLRGNSCGGTENDDDRFEWELTNNETALHLYGLDKTISYPTSYNIRADIARFEGGVMSLRYFEYRNNSDWWPDYISDTLAYSIELTRN